MGRLDGSSKVMNEESRLVAPCPKTARVPRPDGVRHLVAVLVTPKGDPIVRSALVLIT
jgi:hypothetical protein